MMLFTLVFAFSVLSIFNAAGFKHEGFRITIDLCCCLLHIFTALAQFSQNDWQKSPNTRRCLTGYMTDVQSWVDESGVLATTENIISSSVVISGQDNVRNRLQQSVAQFACKNGRQIKYLSMAKCRMTRVPSVFNFKDNCGEILSDTIEYATFYGNNFGGLDADAHMYDVMLNASQANEINLDIPSQREQLSLWSVGFQGTTFTRLKEIDLRACSIKALGNHSFQRMPELKSLYLGENNILYIEAHAFSSLTSLKHLDLSRNNGVAQIERPREMVFGTPNIFQNISLESVDFSFTNFGRRNLRVLNSLKYSLETLSICYSGIGKVRDEVVLDFPYLKYLDVSGNIEILSSPNLLRIIRNSLNILYAEEVMITNMEIFLNFTELEILKLSNNAINTIPALVVWTLQNLQILDLDNNRITSWFSDVISLMRNIKLLSLKNNNINTITRQMFFDIKDLQYISLHGNFLVCNCFARDVFEVGLRNELQHKAKLITEINNGSSSNFALNIGFQHFNDIIQRRRNISSFTEKSFVDVNEDVVGNYMLLNYDEFTTVYQCLLVVEGRTTEVYNLASCSQDPRGLEVLEEYTNGWNRLLLIIIPGVMLPLLFFIYGIRKNLRYFMITMRNSAMLSLINKEETRDVESIFNYDVFVSYCNDDRGWVLDQLLPHVERDCNISVCLHERDFQVGLSILENIVSCMDRSRSIMLIISKKFLLSQWCQFEMHLAQHRLLETRREDLILILLEEIPRRLRPNTLHYLMLTKTYIVWPKEESERNLFWKRMKKSLYTHKLKQQENVSLA